MAVRVRKWRAKAAADGKIRSKRPQHFLKQRRRSRATSCLPQFIAQCLPPLQGSRTIAACRCALVHQLPAAPAACPLPGSRLPRCLLLANRGCSLTRSAHYNSFSERTEPVSANKQPDRRSTIVHCTASRCAVHIVAGVFSTLRHTRQCRHCSPLRCFSANARCGSDLSPQLRSTE